jgi:hypothetical protein
LKALRRLEHDKSTQTERPLREQVASAPESKRGIPMAVAVGGIFATGLALGAAALILWPRPDAVVAGEDLVGVAAGSESEELALEPEPGEVLRVASVAESAPAPPAERARDLPKQAFESSVAVVERASSPEDETTVIELAGAPARDGVPPEGVRPAAEAMKPRPRFRPAPPPTSAPDSRRSPARIPSSARAATPQRDSSPLAASSSATPNGSTSSAPLPEGVRIASPDRPAPPPEAKAPVASPPTPENAATSAQRVPGIPEITPKPATPPAAAPTATPSATPTPSQPAAARAESASKPVSISASAAAPAPPVAAVQVARTHWHPTPDKRIAIVEVEGRPGPVELHEGDLVGSLVVGTIQPSGVVFLRDGVEVRQPVGTRR